MARQEQRYERALLLHQDHLEIARGALTYLEHRRPQQWWRALGTLGTKTQHLRTGKIALPNEPAIDVRGTAKTYRGGIQALRGVNLRVERGEIFGLLGPNGAGKSTLVKIFMTVIKPSLSEGMLLGKPIGHKPTLRRVGYLPEHARLPHYLTGYQALLYYGGLTGQSRRSCRRTAEHLLKTVGMSSWAKKRVSTYSKGMLQRIGLAQAMMNKPDLIMLDEPTDGVDPMGRREIRDLILSLREQGTTIFINSHLLSELEMICDRVAILVQGQVNMQGTIDDLTAASQRIDISFQGPSPQWLQEHPELNVNTKNNTTTIHAKNQVAVDVQWILDRLRSEQRVIESFATRRETLEDLFMRAVTDEDTGQVADIGAAKKKSQVNTGGAK